MAGWHSQRPQRTRHDSILEAYDGTGKTLAWAGKLIDISSGGACFTAARELNTGDTVKATVRIFGEGVKEISGRIVWTRKDARGTLYGLKFDATKKIYPTGELK